MRVCVCKFDIVRLSDRGMFVPVVSAVSVHVLSEEVCL